MASSVRPAFSAASAAAKRSSMLPLEASRPVRANGESLKAARPAWLERGRARRQAPRLNRHLSARTVADMPRQTVLDTATGQLRISTP